MDRVQGVTVDPKTILNPSHELEVQDRTAVETPIANKMEA